MFGIIQEYMSASKQAGYAIQSVERKKWALNKTKSSGTPKKQRRTYRKAKRKAQRQARKRS